MTRKIYLLTLAVGLLSFGLGSCKKVKCKKSINELQLNQIQTLGSHNSYRIKTYQPIFDYVMANAWLIPEEYDPTEWDYNHIPIEEQLEDYGMRSFELDIYHDPVGGRFYNQQGKALVNEDIASNVPELLDPGMKLMHIPDMDYETHYPTFIGGLQAIKTWSDANPNHLPIVIMIEPKTQTIGDTLSALGFVTALPFTKPALDSIDMEINSVFAPEDILTPDDVRGSAATLNQAITTTGWPLVGDSRGKVMFVMMTSSQETTDYLDGHPSLQGRTCFTFASPGEDHAAFLKYDNPTSNLSTIQQYVSEGYMIRTRADASTTEARSGDYTQLNNAFTSGAQIVSTDYYKPDYRADTSANWSSYYASTPNGQVATVNSVNAADSEVDDDCENFEY